VCGCIDVGVGVGVDGWMCVNVWVCAHVCNVCNLSNVSNVSRGRRSACVGVWVCGCVGVWE